MQVLQRICLHQNLAIPAVLGKWPSKCHLAYWSSA